MNSKGNVNIQCPSLAGKQWNVELDWWQHIPTFLPAYLLYSACCLSNWGTMGPQFWSWMMPLKPLQRQQGPPLGLLLFPLPCRKGVRQHIAQVHTAYRKEALDTNWVEAPQIPHFHLLWYNTCFLPICNLLKLCLLNLHKNKYCPNSRHSRPCITFYLSVMC